MDSFLVYRNYVKVYSLRNKSVRKIKKKQIPQRAGSWYDVREEDTICFMYSQGSHGVCFCETFASASKKREKPIFMEEKKTPVIRVKHLYKIYQVGANKVYALNGVDFTMYKGEFCAIVGPSGSGKSTLLNMLAGLEKPTKGEIIIAGKHMERMDENQLVQFRRENVGFIFQSYNLLKTLNAIENVALPLSFRGVPKKERNEKAEKYLKLVGLKKQMNHMANEMSGGQQQRVGIARALVVDPKIIFADEPTGNLDSKTTMEVLKLMQRIVREQNQTLVMVTHDNQIAAYADRQFHIVDGKIQKIEEKKRPDEEEKRERGEEL